MTNTELKVKAFQILNEHLGPVEMETFIALIQQENFDYTHWRRSLFPNLTAPEISALAMQHQTHAN